MAATSPEIAAMVVYEVRVSVDAGVRESYRAWIDGHVREILALPGFERAELYVEDADGGEPVFVIRYHLVSRAALEDYLRDHAPRLRAEGLARFGDRMRATRRVLALERQW
jgi:quinol monooxygenase YgiN